MPACRTNTEMKKMANFELRKQSIAVVSPRSALQLNGIESNWLFFVDITLFQWLSMSTAVLEFSVLPTHTKPFSLTVAIFHSLLSLLIYYILSISLFTQRNFLIMWLMFLLKKSVSTDNLKRLRLEETT